MRLKKTGAGEEMVGESDATKRRRSMILDGIQHGERESTKIYFSRDVLNI